MSTERVMRTGGVVTVILCALGLSGLAANADIPEITFQITVESGDLTATKNITRSIPIIDPDAPPGERIILGWGCDLGEMAFYDDATYLGSVNDLSFTYYADPEVNLNFSVQAGASDTTFHIASSLLGFPTISNAVGLASAGITVTDITGDNAWVQGIGDTGGAYLAQYNGWAGYKEFPSGVPNPQGTTFAEGIAMAVPLTAGWYGSASEAINVGSTAIGDSVDDMSSLFHFEMSASDLASGTSHYQIIPEPGVLALLALGAATLLRRRS